MAYASTIKHNEQGPDSANCRAPTTRRNCSVMASIDRTALRADAMAQTHRTTASLARELVMADDLAREAFGHGQWDRAQFWLDRRDEIRDRRSRLMRSRWAPVWRSR